MSETPSVEVKLVSDDTSKREKRSSPDHQQQEAEQRGQKRTKKQQERPAPVPSTSSPRSPPNSPTEPRYTADLPHPHPHPHLAFFTDEISSCPAQPYAYHIEDSCDHSLPCGDSSQTVVICFASDLEATVWQVSLAPRSISVQLFYPDPSPSSSPSASPYYS